MNKVVEALIRKWDSTSGRRPQRKLTTDEFKDYTYDLVCDYAYGGNWSRKQFGTVLGKFRGVLGKRGNESAARQRVERALADPQLFDT